MRTHPLAAGATMLSLFSRIALLSGLLVACSTSSSNSPSPDGGSTPGEDAAVASDGATAVDGGHDGGSLPACVPIGSQAPDAGLSCTALDAGLSGDGGAACTPPSVVTFTPRWIPPTGYHQGKCTTAQRQTYRAVCLGTQSDGGAACRAFVGTAEGQACHECILPSTSATLGALIASRTGFVSVNVAGCIALLEPCNESCAHDLLATQECQASACSACGGIDEQNACESAATDCGCNTYAAKSACVDLLVGADHPAAACMGADFDTAYATAVDAFCGSP